MRPFEEIRDEIIKAMSINDIATLRERAHEMQTLGTPQADAIAFNALGVVDRFIGDYPTALENFRRALSLNEELGIRSGVASVTVNIGKVFALVGDYPSALEHYYRALPLLEGLDNRAGVASTMLNLGIVYANLGDYPSSLDHFRRSLNELEKLGDRAGVANVTCNMGNLYHITGEYQSALEHHRRALALHEELGDRSSVAIDNNNMANAYQDLGEFSLALEHYRRALVQHEESGNLPGVAQVTSNIIRALLDVNEHDEAAELLDKHVNMNMDDPAVRAAHEAHRAVIAEHREDLEAAREYLQRALAIAIESSQQAESAGYHKSLRDLAQKRNDFAGFIEHNAEFLRISEEVRGKEATQKMAMMEAERNMEGERREREKERALLYGALPESVANRMLRGEDVSGDHFDHASVMFLDIVGFTTNAQDLEPRVVTELLDDVFNAFDELCAAHNVTKIKTIGDAYLAVAFPQDDESTEQNIAFVALGIQQLQFTWPHGSPLQFRIGLHSGPVVAGVIGKQRLQYDVWGDTVNVASRMESTGEPGRVHVSAAFAINLKSNTEYTIQNSMSESENQESHEVNSSLVTTHLSLNSSLVTSHLSLSPRGFLDIKGKGSMQAYWLTSTHTD